MSRKILYLLPFIAIVFFVPALTGPLLLDDTIHLGQIQNWLFAKTGTHELILENSSGPFGRPVSIISFMLNALTTGEAVWPMKASNLFLHLMTGLCLAALFYRLFKRDQNLVLHAGITSIAAASLWLILPQHISTVFYVIQRMTIMATLFAIMACWSYVVFRERMERKEERYLLPLAGIAFFSILSVLSKETGLLIPLYCFLIELLFFRPSVEKPRPASLVWLFRVGVVLPCLSVAAYLAFNPGFVLAPYVDRPFTMPERLMTQISVLADYTASTFFPMTRSAGVFNDDFPIAHSMGAKEYLLVAIGTGFILAAFRFRKSLPSFSFGIGLFFLGHLLESSLFSLEIYFSHRNYLPSMGLIIALFGLVAGLLNHYSMYTASFRRILPLAFIGLFITYGLASFSRATLWSSNDSLMIHAQIHHPASSRMRSEILLGAMYARQLDVALQQADIAMKTSPDNEKRTIQLWRILAYCYAQAPQPESEVDALLRMPADRIPLATITALEYVSAAAEANACPGLDRKKLGLLAGQWAMNTVQNSDSPKVWKTHLASARLLASSGDLNAGLKQALRAFYDSGYDFDSGLLAYQLANSLEDREQKQELMSRLTSNKAMYTKLQQSHIETLQKFE